MQKFCFGTNHLQGSPEASAVAVCQSEAVPLLQYIPDNNVDSVQAAPRPFKNVEAIGDECQGERSQRLLFLVAQAYGENSGNKTGLPDLGQAGRPRLCVKK